MTKSEALFAVMEGADALEMMLGLWEEFFLTSSALKHYKPCVGNLRAAYERLLLGELSDTDYSKVPF